MLIADWQPPDETGHKLRAEAVENHRLLLLCLHPGVHCPGVVFVGVNGSDNPNCQNCRLAQMPESSGWLHWWK